MCGQWISSSLMTCPRCGEELLSSKISVEPLDHRIGQSNLGRFDSAYCVAVFACIAAFLGNAFLLPVRIIVITYGTLFGLMGLFFVGLILQTARRRIFTPWPIAACIVATGLWTAILGSLFVADWLGYL